MKCRKCKSEFAVENAKFCPYCGAKLQVAHELFTEEQDEFLRQHNILRAELTELFNERFGTNKTRSAISHRCSRLGMKLSKEIRYNNPINTKYKVGDEIMYRGYIWVKVSEECAHHADTRFQSKCWKRKHYMIWEEANGPIPEGMVIVHLDGNKTNNELSNLYCTTKSNALFTSNPLVFESESAESKKAALMWGELKTALKE